MRAKIGSTMNRDITATPGYQATERFLAAAMAAGTGQVFDLADLAVAPDGKSVAATGSLIDRLEGQPQQRICLIDLDTGALTHLTTGEHRDRLPRWSPDGARIAWLSDVSQAYDFQLRIMALDDRSTVDVAIPGHWVEAIEWSADGSQVLLLAAGLGADLAGVQGAIAAPVASEDTLAWAPQIDLGTAETQWRSLWIYDLAAATCRRASRAGVNIWEGCWCGPGHLACIASDGPSEDHWYDADVRRIDIASGDSQTLYRPHDQVGVIVASPTGHDIAFIEAICSDRMLVAGTVMLGGVGGFAPVDTAGVDVTHIAWQGDDALLFAGLRGFETVLGLVAPGAGTCTELWVSDERTFGNAVFPDAAPGAVPGDAVVLAEGYLTAPSLLVLGKGKPERAVAFNSHVAIASGAVCETIAWPAADGLEVQGWLIRPVTAGPGPLIMQIHGGPVWRARPRYVGRGLNALLLGAGYALFQPNPRGSSGQGQDYARAVFGDVGGADARDLLSGLDHLVALGVADPARIGVTGGSYGGFMTAWLVTQDQRFAAAAAVAPVSDWASARLTSHVGRSIEMMIGAQHPGADTLYHARSPAMQAMHATTPTLIVCGALDRSTPPVQGEEFHHALIHAGAQSVLLTYPGEGHGVRSFPAVIDYSARMLDWFMTHMPAHAT